MSRRPWAAPRPPSGSEMSSQRTLPNPLPLVGRVSAKRRVGVLVPRLHRHSLTPPPPPHRKSGVPDLRKRKPISGKPEMGGELVAPTCSSKAHLQGRPEMPEEER